MVVDILWKTCLTFMTFATKTIYHANADYVEYDVKTEERTIPPELEVTKTQHELEIEDCMEDFVKCTQTLGIHFKQNLICGVDYTTKQMKTFDNICHIVYDTCKHDGEWHFEKNGPCEGGYKWEDRLRRAKSLRRHRKLWLRRRSDNVRLLVERFKREKRKEENKKKR